MLTQRSPSAVIVSTLGVRSVGSGVDATSGPARPALRSLGFGRFAIGHHLARSLVHFRPVTKSTRNLAHACNGAGSGGSG
jgi:hypothetical protein